MDAYQFVCAVATHLDTLVANSKFPSLVPKRRRRRPKQIRAVDIHVALVRVLYETLSVELAYAFVPTELIEDPNALAAQLYVAVSRQKIGSSADIANWQRSRAFHMALARALWQFMAGLLNGFDRTQRDLEARLVRHAAHLERLQRDLERVRADTVSTDRTDRWGKIMSDPARAICVLRGMLNVPEEDRAERLHAIIDEATRGIIPLPIELTWIVDRHTGRHLVN